MTVSNTLELLGSNPNLSNSNKATSATSAGASSGPAVMPQLERLNNRYALLLYEGEVEPTTGNRRGYARILDGRSNFPVMGSALRFDQGGGLVAGIAPVIMVLDPSGGQGSDEGGGTAILLWAEPTGAIGWYYRVLIDAFGPTFTLGPAHFLASFLSPEPGFGFSIGYLGAGLSSSVGVAFTKSVGWSGWARDDVTVDHLVRFNYDSAADDVVSVDWHQLTLDGGAMVHDSFTRADNPVNAGNTEDAFGFTWLAMSDTTAPAIGISSGKLAFGSLRTHGRAFLNVGSASACRVEAVISGGVVAAGTEPGITVNMRQPPAFPQAIVVTISASGTRVYEHEADGSLTLKWSDATVWADGDRLGVATGTQTAGVGVDLIIYRNGVKLARVVSSNFSEGLLHSGQAAHGLWCGSNIAARFDDFKIYPNDVRPFAWCQHDSHSLLIVSQMGSGTPFSFVATVVDCAGTPSVSSQGWGAVSINAALPADGNVIRTPKRDGSDAYPGRPIQHYVSTQEGTGATSTAEMLTLQMPPVNTSPAWTTWGLNFLVTGDLVPGGSASLRFDRLTGDDTAILSTTYVETSLLAPITAALVRRSPTTGVRTAHDALALPLTEGWLSSGRARPLSRVVGFRDRWMVVGVDPSTQFVAACMVGLVETPEPTVGGLQWGLPLS